MNDIEQQLQRELSQRSTSSNGSENFLIYLSKKFNSTDYVKIKNPFDHKTGWAYVDPKEQNIESNPQKQIYRVYPGESKLRILEVGEEVVIPGWEAYLGLNRMFNEYAQTSGGDIMNTLNSLDEREKFLDKTFIGILDPTTQKFVKNDEVVADEADAKPAAKRSRKPAAKKASADDILGFADEADAKS